MKFEQPTLSMRSQLKSADSSTPHPQIFPEKCRATLKHLALVIRLNRGITTHPKLSVK